MPSTGTPLVWPMSVTSGLGGTMMPSPEEPPQYTSSSTYCQYENVFAFAVFRP